jgi:hypothetical protein
MGLFLARFLAAAVVLHSFMGVLTPQTATPSGEVVWFSMSEADQGRLVLDPFAKVVDGKLVSVPNGCNDNDPAYKQFAAKYLNPGQSYWVTFRGNAAGRAILQKSSPIWENGVVAQYEGPFLIRGKVMALASNRPNNTKYTGMSRSPTSTEQAAAMDAAKLQFTNAGLPQALVGKLSAEQLEVDSFTGLKDPILIGSFSVEDEAQRGAVHSLFLIATFKGKRMLPEFVWSKISHGENDNQTLEFVDHADLFGDGHQDLVLRLTYSEDYRYQVLRGVKGTHWEKIFESDVLGCG